MKKSLTIIVGCIVLAAGIGFVGLKIHRDHTRGCVSYYNKDATQILYKDCSSH